MRNYVNVKLNSIDNAKEFTKICEMFDEDIDIKKTMIKGNVK